MSFPDISLKGLQDLRDHGSRVLLRNSHCPHSQVDAAGHVTAKNTFTACPVIQCKQSTHFSEKNGHSGIMLVEEK